MSASAAAEILVETQISNLVGWAEIEGHKKGAPGVDSIKRLSKNFGVGEMFAHLVYPTFSYRYIY
jgi:hypothetical protein